jgi:hypothetical protein
MCNLLFKASSEESSSSSQPDQRPSRRRMLLLIVEETDIFDVMNRLFLGHHADGVPPASQKIIDKLKPVPIDSLNRYSFGNCTICLEEFAVGNDTTVSLACNHMYCKECIVPWLQIHNTCPLCRASEPDMSVESIGVDHSVTE